MSLCRFTESGQRSTAYAEDDDVLDFPLFCLSLHLLDPLLEVFHQLKTLVTSKGQYYQHL